MRTMNEYLAGRKLRKAFGRPHLPPVGSKQVFVDDEQKKTGVGTVVGDKGRRKVAVRGEDGATREVERKRTYGPPVGGDEGERTAAARSLRAEGAPMAGGQVFLNAGGRKVTEEQLRQAQLLVQHGVPIDMEQFAQAGYDEAKEFLAYYLGGGDELPPDAGDRLEEDAEADEGPGAAQAGPAGQAARYITPLRQVLEELGDQGFKDLVEKGLAQEGDELLSTGKASHYEVVEGDGLAAALLGTARYVCYAMYAGGKGRQHGMAVLTRMYEAGLRVPFDLYLKGSAARWDRAWGDDKEFGVEYDKEGDRLTARSVEYVLSFRPRDDEEAGKVVAWLLENCRQESQDAVPGSWEVPDVRTNVRGQTEGMRGAVVNFKPVGDKTLLVITQETRLPGFSHRPLQVADDLYLVLAKSLGAARWGRGRPMSLRQGWPQYMHWDRQSEGFGWPF